MSNKLTPILIVVGLLFVLAANVFYVVPQAKQALILQFGEAKGVINRLGTDQPGLYVKAPFVQNVVLFEKRNLGLSLEEQTIVSSDQEQLAVGAYARWRIIDPLLFYQKLQSEAVAETRLETLMVGALRRVLGDSPLNDIVSGRRAELMRAISQQMNAETSRLGVQVVDVRIRQADLPEATAERVFERMKTERYQVAAKIRAEGDEQAAKIRAQADRDVVVTLATAREEAEKIRGEGDAKRSVIYAQAYGKDPEFAAFYRSMAAYEKALPKGTPMVLPPDGDFFRYMRDRAGQTRR